MKKAAIKVSTVGISGKCAVGGWPRGHKPGANYTIVRFWVQLKGLSEYRDGRLTAI